MGLYRWNIKWTELIFRTPSQHFSIYSFFLFSFRAIAHDWTLSLVPHPWRKNGSTRSHVLRFWDGVIQILLSDEPYPEAFICSFICFWLSFILLSWNHPNRPRLASIILSFIYRGCSKSRQLRIIKYLSMKPMSQRKQVW